MQNKKIVQMSAIVGATVGALAASLGFKNIAGQFPFFGSDVALLGYRGFLLASIGIWVFFGVYWEIASKNAAAAKSSESSGSRGVHVALVNVALLLEILPIRGLGRFAPAVPALMAAGLAIEGVGLLLAFWARRHLGRFWSGEITIKVEHELIRSGPYRRLRHPIYTGLLAMYLGVAVVTGEWLAVVGFGLAVLAYWRKIRLEETNLEAAFGDQYHDYRRTSWALLPGLL